ncbi:TIGR02186 family protein [Martelella alba]|uniref:TIGR02186 family protein n=1 Tax=Martelella alba TaxID=2590451 RepID=A0A506UDS0_9HYPH|nr:TIGR02186 family protein [Martelella alba]TPW30975.1 TIGR02186 family protein [Martelella alba]
MRALLALALCLLPLAGIAHAQVPTAPPADTTAIPAESLELGTSTSEIAITSDFSGATLTVFGAINNARPKLLKEGAYDIVVVLEGPKAQADIREKDRVFGIWINRKAVTFGQVPRFYSISSTRPLDQISSEAAMINQGIGIDNLRLPAINYVGEASDIPQFRDALLRLNTSQGLYNADEHGVKFVSNSLFRASLMISVNIPEGPHSVEAFLYRNGELIATQGLPLRVVKTGLEQQLTEAAHNHPLPYGLATVALALMSGWLASILFRKP